MPNFAANLTMMFNEYDFLDRFKAASQSGFKGVEFLFPYDYNKQEILENLKSNNLNQVLHDLPAGNWDAGDRGNACQPDRIGEFQDGVGLTIEYAKVLECPNVTCLAGIPENNSDPEKLKTTFIDNLKFAAYELKKHNIKLLIEPINTIDIPGFYLTNTDQALSIIKEVNSDNIGLQYDIYHMQIMEGNLTRTIQSNIDSISHFQLADNPGRNEPGTGEINYPFIFETIDKLDYKGWIGCEYKPVSTTENGLDWVKKHLLGAN